MHVRRKPVACLPFFWLVLGVGGCESVPPPVLPSAEEHRAEIEEWQARRAAELREPDSWLSLVGLFWLAQGENPVGSDPAMAVVLPGDGVPPWVGTLTLRGRGSLEYALSPSARSLHPSEDTEPVQFRVDASGPPPVFRWGTLSWFVIERFGQYGVRLRDSAAPAFQEFHGIDRYPTDAGWRILGRFQRYDPPKEIPAPNVLDVPSTSNSPGAVVFAVDGQEYRLDVTGNPDSKRFSVVFGDETNGGETYGGGRFLSVEAPFEGDWIVIDFNRAYNPPCVFTAFATCPLPPPQNKLALRVEAGEKMYFGGAHREGH